MKFAKWPNQTNWPSLEQPACVWEYKKVDQRKHIGPTVRWCNNCCSDEPTDDVNAAVFDLLAEDSVVVTIKDGCFDPWLVIELMAEESPPSVCNSSKDWFDCSQCNCCRHKWRRSKFICIRSSRSGGRCWPCSCCWCSKQWLSWLEQPKSGKELPIKRACWAGSTRLMLRMGGGAKRPQSILSGQTVNPVKKVDNRTSSDWKGELGEKESECRWEGKKDELIGAQELKYGSTSIWSDIGPKMELNGEWWDRVRAMAAWRSTWVGRERMHSNMGRFSELRDSVSESGNEGRKWPTWVSFSQCTSCARRRVKKDKRWAVEPEVNADPDNNIACWNSPAVRWGKARLKSSTAETLSTWCLRTFVKWRIHQKLDDGSTAFVSTKGDSVTITSKESYQSNW